MTFRARPVVKRTDRAGRSPRRSLLLNLGFGLVIVVALLILAAAAAASYYGDHLASIASVNGHDISKDQLRVLLALPDVPVFVLDRLQRR